MSSISRIVKAFIVVLVIMLIATYILYRVQAPASDQLRRMARISAAVDEFYFEYKVYPCTGPMGSQCRDEMEGTSNAKLNLNHIDYLGKNQINSLSDRWGHPYVLSVSVGTPNQPHAIIISCGPNGIFENGQGDDISFP